ncbi:Glycoside hydrolase superfamily [Phytophthora cactorum]|nr:Glycoside hydrolase superfamily [Phytophthora cactorum]
MTKIINSGWLVAVIAFGAVGINATAKPQTDSLLGSSRLPELNILADTEPPSTRGSNEAGYATTFLSNPLLIKGNRFFDSVSGDYFAIRGVNYYPRPNTGPLDKNNLDLFSNDFKHIWQRDVPQFAALEANVIRLYAVDPDVDHTDFMCALQSEGIYVVVDLGANCEGCTRREDHRTVRALRQCHGVQWRQRDQPPYGGNPWTWNAPCQKKFIRDMRAFIQSCPNLRKVPVGLVVADTDRDENAQYYNCRTDESDELENAQWYGINTYVHCDDISDPTKATGFNLLRDSFKSYDYSIPVVLTEFGCVSPAFPTVDGYEAQRTFHDAAFMNLPEYSDYFAGGVAFEYSTENANSMSTSATVQDVRSAELWLGYFSPEDCTDTGTNCTFERFPNFEFLKERLRRMTARPANTEQLQDPLNHAETSACPKGSPILSDFIWEGDSSSSEACPSKAEARYQCPNLPVPSPSPSPAPSPSPEDGSLQLDEINSGSGTDSGTDSVTVPKSGVASACDGVLISLLVSVFAGMTLSH